MVGLNESVKERRRGAFSDWGSLIFQNYIELRSGSLTGSGWPGPLEDEKLACANRGLSTSILVVRVLIDRSLSLEN